MAVRSEAHRPSRHQHVLRLVLDSVACAFALSPGPRERPRPCSFYVGQMETREGGHPSEPPAFSGQVDQAAARLPASGERAGEGGAPQRPAQCGLLIRRVPQAPQGWHASSRRHWTVSSRVPKVRQAEPECKGKRAGNGFTISLYPTHALLLDPLSFAHFPPVPVGPAGATRGATRGHPLCRAGGPNSR